MPTGEQSERIVGAALLSVPAFDFFVWALDNYARLELAVKLHEALPPFLLNPTTGFICMCVGLSLLYFSQKAHMSRLVESAEGGDLINPATGKAFRRETRLLWPRTVGIMFLIALLATPILGVGYSLAYKGSPPDQLRPLPPAIAYSKTPIPPVSAGSPRISVAQTGRDNISQIGSNNQASIKTTPTIQSVLLVAKWACTLKPNTERPLLTDRTFAMMSTKAALLYAGQPELWLEIQSPIHQEEENGKLLITARYITSPEYGWIGKPIDSFPPVDAVAAGLLFITLSDCTDGTASPVGMLVVVNGAQIWQTAAVLNLKDGKGDPMIYATAASWPSRDELTKTIAP